MGMPERCRVEEAPLRGHGGGLIGGCVVEGTCFVRLGAWVTPSGAVFPINWADVTQGPWRVERPPVCVRVGAWVGAGGTRPRGVKAGEAGMWGCSVRCARVAAGALGAQAPPAGGSERVAGRVFFMEASIARCAATVEKPVLVPANGSCGRRRRPAATDARPAPEPGARPGSVP